MVENEDVDEVTYDMPPDIDPSNGRNVQWETSDSESSWWTDNEETSYNVGPQIPVKLEPQFQIEQATEEHVAFDYAMNNAGHTNDENLHGEKEKRKSIQSRRKLGGETSDSDTSWWSDGN